MLILALELAVKKQYARLLITYQHVHVHLDTLEIRSATAEKHQEFQKILAILHLVVKIVFAEVKTVSLFAHVNKE